MNSTRLFAVLACATLAACRPADRGAAKLPPGGLALTHPADNTARAPELRRDGLARVVAAPDLVRETIFSGEDRGGDPAAPVAKRLIAEMPRLGDDLRSALSQQRRLLLRQDPERAYAVGGRELTNADFLEVIDRLLLYPDHRFVPEAIPVAREGEVKFTAYFTPELQASRTKTGAFRYPVLGVPSDDSTRRLPRAALVNAAQASPGDNVLAWVQHPLDLYHMQLQGSGYLRFRDGHREYLGFGGSNGRPLTPIARALAESAWDVPYRSVAAIRKWMSADLAARGEVLDACANYVYFRRGATRPTGAGAVTLSPMVSVAADPAHYPLGAVLLAAVPNPSAPGVTETRVLLVQDVGAAIKGRHRLDLYTGIGPEALRRAQHMSHVGEVFVLAPQTIRLPDPTAVIL